MAPVSVRDQWTRSSYEWTSPDQMEDIKDKDVLRARLSGPQGGTAHTVRIQGKYFYVGPDKEFREVPADTLTDALHAGVFMRNEEIKAKKKLPHKKRPMPHVSLSKPKKKKA